MEVREKYSPEDYEAFGIGEYRIRFPDETSRMSDEKLFNIVVSTDDDMDDDGWRELLTK